MSESLKRKRGAQDFVPIEGKSSNVKPTRICSTGKDAKAAIESSSKDAIVALEKQIRVPHSQQSTVGLTHPSVVLMQQYLALSPKCDEVLMNWKHGSERKNTQLVEISIQLLTTIINLLVPVPYFRPTLQNLVEKFLDTSENYGNMLTRMILSTKREHAHLGMGLAAALVHVDPGFKGVVSRINGRMWTMIADSGCLRALPKLLSMRRKGGFAAQADPLDKPDIRHLTIHFLLPFLAYPLFLSGSKPMVIPLFSNLKDDPARTIYRVLDAIWDAINSSPSGAVNRKTSVALLHENSIDGIVKLYKRDGSDDEDDKVNEVSPAEMAHQFLLKTCTKPGVGVCFQDQGWYKRKGKGKADDLHLVEADLDGGEDGGNQKDGSAYGTKMLHNHILGNVVRRIGPRAVEEPKIAELVYSILGSCPELVASFWPHSGISVDPRLSAKWLATMALLGHVISLPLPSEETFHVNTGISASDGGKEMVAKATPPALQVIIEAVLPSPLSKQHLSKGLQHSVGLVQHETALTLARALQKLLIVKAAFTKISKEVRSDMGNDQFDDSWSKCLRELEMEARKRVPEVPVIIAFAQKSAASQALQASLEEADEGEKAKAVLLTESALRLFRLYYRALPNMAAEFRFDVGKLLVSSSSAKQEAAARKMAREGSVIDDTGSVASFGTVGSAGMGGGFGQSRGDVAEFDALSQVHVLELLASVREWDWTAKAAGSAYSYVYHILQLRLSTPHLRTVQVTEKLLAEMIGQSIMFDHDRSEWSLWMDCLPRTRALGIKTSAALALERLHLLGFIDDCVRRCMKTPYRYIEESASLAAKHPVNIDRSSWSSPLLFAMFEQFQAKLAGHHIAADAAEVVLVYLRNVILAMTAKQADLGFVRLLQARLQTCLSAAELKRETTLPVLAAQLQVLSTQLDAFGGEHNTATPKVTFKDVEGEDAAENLRRQVLAAPPCGASNLWNILLGSGAEREVIVQIVSVTPFAVLLANLNDEVDTSMAFDLLRDACLLLESNEDRSLQFSCMLNRLAGFSGSTALTGHTLELLVAHLEVTQGSDSSSRSTKIRQLVTTPAIQAVMLSRDPRIRKNLTLALRNTTSSDTETITQVAEQAGNLFLGMNASEQAVHGRAFAIWTKFLPSSRIEQIFASLARAKIGHRDQIHLLARLLQHNRSLSLVMEYLGFILTHKLQLPALEGVRELGAFLGSGRAIGGRHIEESVRFANIAARLNLDGIDLVRLSPSGLRLVKFCANSSVNGTETLTAAMETIHWTSGSLGRLRPLYQEADLEAIESSRPGFLSLVAESALADTAEDADVFFANTESLLLDRVHRDKRLVGSILGLLRENRIAFTSKKIEVLRLLSQSANDVLSAKLILEAAVQWLTPQLAYDTGLSATTSCTLQALGEYSRRLLAGFAADTVMSTEQFVRSTDVEIAGHLVEPLLAAVIQDRIHTPAAVSLAAALCEKSPIKAMIVRQHLQLLLNVERLNKAMQQDPIVARRSVAKLALALFNSSPYSACQASFIEPLVRLYKGTLDPADIDLMSICGLYERYKRVSLSKAIVALWTPQLNMAADENDTPLDAIKQLDPRNVFATCIAFERQADQSGPSQLYDSRFVLSLTAACLREGPLTGLQWVEILRSNVLALASCALSSRSSEQRSMAGTVLAAAVEMVQTTPFQEQPALKRLLSLLRHGTSVGEDGVMERLPFMMALFFAHALRTIGEPSSYLYPLISAFLLRRPIMDFRDVPMLYDLLYAAGQGSKRERRWMVRFIRDSVRSRSDWQICKRRHTFALLASIFQSTTDYNFRALIIQALQTMTAVPEAAIHLAEKEGLVEWLEMSCLSDISLGKGAAIEDVVLILENVVAALVQRDMSKSTKVFERERRWHIQLLGCIYRLAPVRDFTILRRLSEMVLRISLTTRSAVAARTLIVLTKNLRELDLEHTAVLDHEEWQVAVESLLRAGMAWDPETLSTSEKMAAVQSLALLSCRVAVCHGPLGDWVRQETKAMAVL